MSLKQAVILHGTKGSPEGNWFPWLANALKDDWNVTIPLLPSPDNQNLQSWIKAYQKQVPQQIDVIIGHSLGATFILKLIEQGLMEPTQAILVSTVIDHINIAEYDALNDSFIRDKINYDKIKKTGTNFTLIHGNNDPYVPLNQPEHIAQKLGINLNLIETGGHLNIESGYTSFPEILGFINA